MEPSEKSAFMLVNVAALRARQLMQGATPLIRSESRKPAAIAIREVNEGLVTFFIPEEELPLPEEEELDDSEDAPPGTEETTE